MGKLIKGIIIVCAVFMAHFNVSALSLTMRNGYVYPNVRIENIMPNGIGIRTYDSDADAIGFATVLYRDMTDQTRQEVFQYIHDALQRQYPDLGKNMPSANNTGIGGTSAAASVNAGTGNKVQVPLAPTQSFSGAYAPISGVVPNAGTVYLPGMPHNITLESIAVLDNGTLGYADSENSAFVTTPTHYGKIFVYGVFAVQGTSWTGTVYPTNKTIYHNVNVYPCFATTPEMAQKIDDSVY